MIDPNVRPHGVQHRFAHRLPLSAGHLGVRRHTSAKPEQHQHRQPQQLRLEQQQTQNAVRRIAVVPIAALVPGESPRLDGQIEEHVARLAEVDAALPPILVERGSMRVIDGMHRLLAARRRGRQTIEVEFFESDAADAFLHAVKANVTHGLPLSQNDRRAAATRIINSYPHMSDRAIARVTGLGATTIASIRRSSPEAGPPVDARVGQDGKVRPLDAARGRLRAAELFAERPEASLRQIAREAGVSPATAADVRKRLERGELPTSPPTRPPRAQASAHVQAQAHALAQAQTEPVVPTIALAKLLRDPSLRHSEMGRTLLAILRACATGTQNWDELIAAVPLHWTSLVEQLAHHCARLWQEFAQEMDVRTHSAADNDSQHHEHSPSTAVTELSAP